MKVRIRTIRYGVIDTLEYHCGFAHFEIDQSIVVIHEPTIPVELLPDGVKPHATYVTVTAGDVVELFECFPTCLIHTAPATPKPALSLVDAPKKNLEEKS